MASDMIALCEDSSLVIMTMESTTIASSSGTANAVVDDDDSFEDGCSICLEPFSSTDPPSVTSCKHEYHLQCILEWSQRSKECPICSQLFVLKDPASQELLAAVENERLMRSRTNIRLVNQEHDVNHDVPSIDASDLEKRILQHFAAAKSLVNRRRRQSSAGLSPSQVLPSVPIANASNTPHIHDSPEENNSLVYGVEVGLPASVAPASSLEPKLLSDKRDGPAMHRYQPVNFSEVDKIQRGIFFGQTSSDGPQKSSSSELLAFSESVKAKLSAASAKYKESFSKSTRGFKEKLLARNSSVKELSRGVQREMNAGIAGVARMIERFDLSLKRTGDSVPLSSYLETPDLISQGKEVEQTATTQSLTALSGETTHDMNSDVFPPNSTTIPGQVNVSFAQSKH